METIHWKLLDRSSSTRPIGQTDKCPFGPSFGGFLGAGLTGNPEHGIVRLGYLKLPERHENPKQNPAGVLYVGFVPALIDCVACNKERLGNLSFRARLLLCPFHVDNKSFRIVISCRDDYFILDGSEIAMASAYAWRLEGSHDGTTGWQ